MTEFMTLDEMAERERNVEAFKAAVHSAETNGYMSVNLTIAQAAEIRNELERLEDIEDRYDRADPRLD